jgi:hypothetical protein
VPVVVVVVVAAMLVLVVGEMEKQGPALKALQALRPRSPVCGLLLLAPNLWSESGQSACPLLPVPTAHCPLPTAHSPLCWWGLGRRV